MIKSRLTLTLTMKTSQREVKKRRAALKASGRTKVEVQRLAGVAERNVYKWYAGQLTSQRIAAAHATLTNGVVARERASA